MEMSISTLEKIREIKKLAIEMEESYKVKKGVFTTEYLSRIEREIQKCRNLKAKHKVNKVSLRTAAIIVIEETMIRKNCSRDFLNLFSIVNQTKVRYKTYIGNRDGSNFISIEHIHPKHPCIFYDSTTSDEKLNKSNRAKRGSYRKSLEKILHGKDWLEILDETETRISDTLSIVKLC